MGHGSSWSMRWWWCSRGHVWQSHSLAWHLHLCSHLGHAVVLAVGEFGHAANATRSVLWILVAVSPAVDGALNKSTLSTQTWVELCQAPANGVAVGLVPEAVTPVLILAAASTWVNAVLALKVGAQVVNVDSLNIAADGIFHLDTISRVLKGNPLNPILVLSDNQWCGCWDWARVGGWVDTCSWDVVLGSVWWSIEDLLVVLLWRLTLLNWC